MSDLATITRMWSAYAQKVSNALGLTVVEAVDNGFVVPLGEYQTLKMRAIKKEAEKRARVVNLDRPCHERVKQVVVGELALLLRQYAHDLKEIEDLAIQEINEAEGMGMWG